MSIVIQVLDPFQHLVSTDRLQAALAAVLVQENASGDVTLVLTDDPTIADLNRRFLDQDGPTDVLSFPAQDASPTTFVLPPDVDPYLGDIVIAYPYAAAQAERLGHAIADELDLLTVHGALHLLGYDHAEPEEEAAMWARQDAILRALRLSRLPAHA